MNSRDLEACSNEELFRLLGSGRSIAHAAFAELYGRHSPRVYTYCRRILGDASIAEDLFQETFVRFYNSARQRQEMTNVPAFLLRIARNLCLNAKMNRHFRMIPLEEFHLPVSSYQTYESAELMTLIEAAMETLPDDYREALILREQLGLSYNEIAEVVGTSMPVVRTRIYRAKEKLRLILAPYLADMQQ